MSVLFTVRLHLCNIYVFADIGREACDAAAAARVRGGARPPAVPPGEGGNEGSLRAVPRSQARRQAVSLGKALQK